MKVIIWILTIFIGSFLNSLLAYAVGIKAGAFLLYIVEFYVAHKLCEKWDEHKQGVQEAVQCDYQGDKSDEDDSNRGSCRECESKTNVSLDGAIINTSDAEKDKEREVQIEPCGICDKENDVLTSAEIGVDEAESADTVENVMPSYCRKCGAKLFEDSLFCNKCGTKVL